MEQKITTDKETGLPEEIHRLIKEILRPMYIGGETVKLLAKSEAMLKKLQISPESKERDNLVAETRGCRSWAFYRQKDFLAAETEAKLAGDNETALRCLAAIAAYYYKDLQMLKFYVDQLPDSPAKDNPLTIAARKPDDNTPQDVIIERAMKWVMVDPWDPLNTANLMNNTARWLFDHESRQLVLREDNILAALGYMQSAIGLYGSGQQNLHHRAGAWFWTSKFLEKIFGKASALMAAKMSVELWKEQLVLDLTNKNFIASFEGAKKHLQSLKETKICKEA